MSASPIDAHRWLPTRVTSACQRCRRNKTRCDSYRPCSLCKRANVECAPASRPPNTKTQDRPSKRVRQDADVSVGHLGSQIQARSNGQESPLSSDGGHFLNTQMSTSVTIESQTAQNDDSPELTGLSPVKPVKAVKDYGEAESAIGLTRRIFLLSRGPMRARRTSAIPDGGSNIDAPPEPQVRSRYPIASILGCDLPSTTVILSLLEEYFTSVHWFSLVIYEPKFRAQLETIMDGFALESQKTFLILVATVLGVAAWYRSQGHHDDPSCPNESWASWTTMLLNHTESKVFQLMDHTSLAAVQTFILLGSYNVYHGKPNSAFALLGATIKAAQALGLHRAWTRGTLDDAEERKRVWWTIYTWDRFASITYGRPLGINDQDCNVTMPSDIYESVHFGSRDCGLPTVIVCFSTYQRQLNELYLIASPLIEAIFGLRSIGSLHHLAVDVSSSSLERTTARLWEWKQQLPSNLTIDLDEDVPINVSLETKIHRLQALALQLTFDSIIIILHRPSLIQQFDVLSVTDPGGHHDQFGGNVRHYQFTQSDSSLGTTDLPTSSNKSPSTEQWWNAAVQTSRITALPQLAQLATDSHLVAFLAINIFNAAVVMVVFALSDPLSDKAQEAKRYITRVYRLLGLLGKRFTLPRQSSIILQDVIRLMLQHEEAAMLSTVTMQDTGGTVHESAEPSRRSSLWREDRVTVEDALRMPLHALSDFHQPDTEDHGDSSSKYRNEAMRLNESLASVKRIFPMYQLDVSEGNVKSRLRPTTQPTCEESTFVTDEGISASGWGGDEFGGVSGIDSGVFWMWDSMNSVSTWQ